MNLINENKPIFIQVAEEIEDKIITGIIREGEQVPSTNQFASFYRINPATAAKGINLLVDEGILFKQRGVGMFVAEGAKQSLSVKRRTLFYKQFIEPMLSEARKINLSKEEVLQMIVQEAGEDKCVL